MAQVTTKFDRALNIYAKIPNFVCPRNFLTIFSLNMKGLLVMEAPGQFTQLASC